MSLILAPFNIGRRGAPFLATGGLVSSYTIGQDTFQAHVFLTSGTFVVTGSAGLVEALIVAGGAGGGGAGGMIESLNLLMPVGSNNVIIGAGGGPGINGSNTLLQSVISLGGGHGSLSAPNFAQVGGSGGPGVGQIVPQSLGAAGTPGQGNAGGDGKAFLEVATSGGGGGKGGPGGVGGSNVGGVGGPGAPNSFRTGSPINYAGGGGGSYSHNNGFVGPSGAGGIGGGGKGSISLFSNGQPGEINTGGGGGHSLQIFGSLSGLGGSGIVIIRYTI